MVKEKDRLFVKISPLGNSYHLRLTDYISFEEVCISPGEDKRFSFATFLSYDLLEELGNLSLTEIFELVKEQDSIYYVGPDSLIFVTKVDTFEILTRGIADDAVE